MKKNILALSVGAALSCSAHADILITEITEGSGYNKGIEIANTGTESVTLTGYTLEKDSNGGNSWGSSLALDDVTLGANETYVVVHSDADDALKAKATLTEKSVTNFNGDDPVALKKDGTIVDLVGVYGDKDFNKDITLRRKVMTPSAEYDATKFETLSKDDWSGFGNLDEAPEQAAPEPTKATIQEIQGEGWTSTIGGIDTSNGKYDSGDNYFEVTGVVTAIQKDSLSKGLAQGFTMQAPSDNNELTSDGIVVDTTKLDGLVVGSSVTVVAKVKEDYGLTKLFEVYSVTADGTAEVPAATPLRTIASDVDESGNPDFDKTLERHEGMLVKMDKDADMRVARTFGFDYGPYRNNMVVSHGDVNMHPNQMNEPGSDAAKAQTASNQDRRVTVESFVKAPNGTIPWYPNFAKASAVPMENGTTTTEDYIRIGDTIDGLEGVLSYHYNEFHFYVTNEATNETFVRNIPRTTAPVITEGDLRIGTMNVLNYFNSPFGGSCNPMEDSGSSTGCNNRGAGSQEEFEMQGDKIAAAIVAMDADILGLMEIENNGFGEESAVAHLVNKVNALIPNQIDHYAYVVGNKDDKYVGTDAIANQVIFRPSKVSLETYRLIQMPSQKAPETKSSDGKKSENGQNYQRDSITPTFVVKGTDPVQKITVSVNHFKSKGSTCWEDVDPSAQDGKDVNLQGSCENFRVSAAQHLGTELAKIEGNKMILGDLNSYGSEDPILLLTTLPEGYSVTPARNTFIGETAMDGDTPEAITKSFGFINAAKEKHPKKFSYSYNDEVGTLDYILVDAAMKDMIVDATEWNINAAESTLFEYPSKYTGDMTKFKDMYSSSDHDPAVITLDLGDSVPVLPEPVKPPKAPQNPPADVKEKPEAAKAGEKMKVLFDLTDLGVDLRVGDKVTVSFSKVTTTKIAVQAGGDTTTVTLDQPMIEQGWVELETEIADAGDYQMTKSVIDGTTNDTVYQSQAETVSVAQSSETSSATTSSSGGSLGWFGLMGLFGFGLFRRRK